MADKEAQEFLDTARLLRDDANKTGFDFINSELDISRIFAKRAWSLSATCHLAAAKGCFRHQVLLGRQSHCQAATLTDETESNSANRTSFDPTKNRLDEKISLRVNAPLVNPACRAGVRTSRPNFNARGASRNCNGNEVTPGDR